MFEMLNDLLFIGTRPMLPTSSFNLNVNILAILIIHYVSKNIRGKPVPHAGFQDCGVMRGGKPVPHATLFMRVWEVNPSHTREFMVCPTRGLQLLCKLLYLPHLFIIRIDW